MLTIDQFLSTLIDATHLLDYEDLDRPMQERLNALFGFKPVRRNGVSAARKIEAPCVVNGFTAQGGDYHVRPLDLAGQFTDDEGWVVDGDIFRATYAWRALEPDGAGEFAQCRKSVATWVYDTTQFFPWDSAVIVSTLEADQPLCWGDWLAIGVNGELWPIPAKDHVNFETVEGVR
jgi:hypothetical protein